MMHTEDMNMMGTQKMNEMKPKVIMSTGSLVTCDGGGLLTAESTGLVPKLWDTGLQVFVPDGYFCWFVPTVAGKWKQFILKADVEPQTLFLKSKLPVLKVKQGKELGKLHFLKSLDMVKSVKLEWKEE